MKLVAAGILTLALSSAACGSSEPPAPPKPTAEQDKAAIDKVRNAYTDAFKTGNADAIAALYEDNGVSLTNMQPTANGRDAILKLEKASFEQMTMSDVSITPDETLLMGDWALDRGSYKGTGTMKAAGAAPMPIAGRYIVILHRQADGSWKAARDMDNTDTPPMPPAPPKKGKH
jgi:uncharacterized protein (TIGR02246 family)